LITSPASFVSQTVIDDIELLFSGRYIGGDGLSIILKFGGTTGKNV
jgi:hypothetical protein